MLAGLCKFYTCSKVLTHCAETSSPFLSLAKERVHTSSHCYGTCPRFVIAKLEKLFLQSLNMSLPPRHTCGVVEAISLLTDGHVVFKKTPRHDNPELARGSCSSPLSLRWNVVTEAISLQTTFVFGLLRYARNDKKQDRHTAFAMTTCFYTCRSILVIAMERSDRSNPIASNICFWITSLRS